jgi:hypothetical protein
MLENCLNLVRMQQGAGATFLFLAPGAWSGLQMEIFTLSEADGAKM